VKFVKVEWRDEWRGFWLDPAPYTAELPRLATSMPAGALEFAMEPGHYDFGSSRCVKDLQIAGISAAPHDEVDLVIRFNPNQWKHDEGLVINYTKARKLDIVVSNGGSGFHELGEVLLDEILPLQDGCSHQIALTGGEIYVECVDLHDSWE
jgi:hypothetical protein